jgi:hypothetical protein
MSNAYFSDDYIAYTMSIYTTFSYTIISNFAPNCLSVN